MTDVMVLNPSPTAGALQATDYRGPLTAVQIRAQVNLIQEVMKSVMREGTHYGVIPGTPKPTLYKPGAEKLLFTFRISTDPEIEDLSTTDEIRYRVKVSATAEDGRHLGSSVGECSSSEEKYRWRTAICRAEFEETPEDRRREVWKRKKGGNVEKQQQVRTNPADVANTVLKMAVKRGKIAVALDVTAASDIFTQDIEDLPAELAESLAAEEERTEKQLPPEPRRKSDPPAAAPPVQEAVVVPADAHWVDDVLRKSGTTNGKPWELFLIKIDGNLYSSFDTAHRDVALEAKKTNRGVEFTWNPGRKEGQRDLTSISLVGGAL